MSTISMLIALLVSTLAYFITYTINDIFQTKVADALGDHTAEQQGYDSIDPIEHFELFSYIWLLIFNIGLPRQVPVNWGLIHEPYRFAKLLIIFLSETLITCFMAIVWLLCALIIFQHTFYTDFLALLGTFLASPTQLISTYFVKHSPWSAVLALLLCALILLNICISALSLIFNMFTFALMVAFEKRITIPYIQFISLLGPIIVVFFFAQPLTTFLLQFVRWGAYVCAYYFGVL